MRLYDEETTSTLQQLFSKRRAHLLGHLYLEANPLHIISLKSDRAAF